MASYSKSTNFAVKDSLTTGDPNKILSGVEIDTEFNNISSGFSSLESSIQNIENVPSGAIINFAMQTPPTGFLKANGAEVSRSTYSDLFSAIGTTFGEGDGSNTFNLPDARGEFIRGWDNARGIDSDREFGSLQLDQMQRLIGDLSRDLAGEQNGTSTTGVFDGSGSASNTNAQTGNSNSVVLDFDSANSPNARVSESTDGETRPRNLAMLTCIKF